MSKIMIITAAMVAGGAQRVISQLINIWTDEGVDISLVMTEKMDTFYRIPDYVNINRIGRRNRNPLVDKVKRYREVRRIIKREKPDIILSLPEEIGIYTVLANIGTGIPIVVSERNNPWVMPNVKLTRALRKIAYRFVDGLIFQTENAKSFFPKSIQKKGIVLPNPLELSRIPEPWEGQREKIVVSAGRLEAQKNFALLIEAFSIFHEKHSDYRMIIYGEGRERSVLQEMIKKHGLEYEVSLPGNNSDLLNSIKNSGLFVLSSDYEGVPNVLIEAMAMGLPVVSTDCEPGGAAELIEPGVNGLLAPIRDAQALSEKMCEMIENEYLYRSCSIEALKIKARFEASTVCRDWYQYLEKVIEHA